MKYFDPQSSYNSLNKTFLPLLPFPIQIKPLYPYLQLHLLRGYTPAAGAAISLHPPSATPPQATGAYQQMAPRPPL